MDAQQFLAEFGHIANASGGVNHLRKLVNYLALNGDLTERQATGLSSKEFLTKVLSDKQTYLQKNNLREGKRKSTELDQFRYSLPKEWELVQAENLVRLINGRAFKSSEWSNKGLPIIRIQNLNNPSASFNHFQGKLDDKHLIEPGDMLLSWSGTPGTSFGAFIWERSKGALNQHIFKVIIYSNSIDKNYLKIVINARLENLIANARGGVGLKHVTKGQIEALDIPLPPQEEQSRIVAKVDELMALCDQLEAHQQKRRTLQNQLRQATLQAVAASQSPHELQESWQRLQANFGQLFSAPEDVIAFKGLILDLATSGNLSNIEHRHDSTGRQLLEAIADRRVTWSKETEDQDKKEAQTMLKKLRKQQVIFPDTALPEHWTWGTFLQIAQAVVDCHNKTAPYVANGIHLVRTTDIRNGEMNLANTKKITKETFDYWARRMPPRAGDIFFTREAPMGEAAIVPEGEKVCLGQRTMLLRLFPELFNNRFLLYVIRSPSFQTRMIESAIGMTVKHLRVGGVEDLVVPVPPKPEQDAIVTIIDSLFAVCDRFEKQLSQKQRVAENLVLSSVASLTGVAIEQEEEPMKAPQTELVAPVRLGTPPDIRTQAPLATILARHNGEMSAKDLWQRFGGEIDAFYAQLKTEVAHGWVLEPAPAEVREKANS